MTAQQRSPWAALTAMLVGFFMTLVDTTIVPVATPAIKAALDPASPNLDSVVWVTSAYLLAFAVPLLITGRLGDRFGPKRLYLVGLAVFTLGSLASGLSDSLTMLIAMRAVQGFGAAIMTPQTMAMVTRIFPANKRGAAMGAWGATAGVATLAGPLLGGVLTGAFGWQSIFFINIPVGLVAFALSWWLLPDLGTQPHRFDLLGVVLSASGLFCVVFALQEGEAFAWPPWIWAMLAAGVLLIVLFVRAQRRPGIEPLVPLTLFRDRNYTVSTIGIFTVGFSMTSVMLPLMFFVQLARGLSPVTAGMLVIPMAVLSGVLAPFAGRLLDRTDARVLLIPGMLMVSISLYWYSAIMTMDTPVWAFLLPSALMGVGAAGMWGPLAAVATRSLPVHQAGAGSGVYNTMRTVGAVVGSAAMAALMQARISALVPVEAGQVGFGDGPVAPDAAAGLAAALAQSVLLPASVVLVGFVAVLFLRDARPRVGA